MRVVNLLLPPDFGHLLLVRGHPHGAAGQVLDIRGKLARKLDPELPRVTREGDLRGRIVHHHDMTHARRGSAAADRPRFHHHDREAGRRALRRAGRADDAAAGDGYVVTGAHAPRIP